MECEYVCQVLRKDAIELSKWMRKQAGQSLRKVLQSATVQFQSRDKLPRLFAIVKHIRELAFDADDAEEHKKALKYIIEYFIKANCDVNEVMQNLCPTRRTRDGFTPLLLAIEQRKPIMAKTLMEAGADVNIPDSYGYTPLHWAAYSCPSVHLFKDLLEAGAIVTSSNKKPEIPPILHIAVNEGRIEIVEYLIGIGWDINTSHKYYLLTEKTWPTVGSRYDCGDHADERAWTKVSAIGRAVRMRKIDVLKLLIRHPKAQANYSDLHFCILEGDTRVANLILEIMDTSVIAEDKINEISALHCLGDKAYCTAQTVNKEDLTEETKRLIATYVNAGLDVNIVNTFPEGQWYRSTLLMRAVYHGNDRLVQFLLEIGADPHLCLQESEIVCGEVISNLTALHIAIFQKDIVALRILEEHGADLFSTFGPLVFDSEEISNHFRSTNLRLSPNTLTRFQLVSSSLISTFEREISYFEKFLTVVFDNLMFEYDVITLKWLAQYLEKVKHRLEKIHVVLAVLGGNVFVVSNLVKNLPENLSLKEFVVLKEIPALQYLFNYLLYGDTTLSIFRTTPRALLIKFGKKLTEITVEFVRRGYDLNDFKYMELFPKPVVFFAIVAANYYGIEFLLNVFTNVEGFNWNVRLQHGHDVDTPLSFAWKCVVEEVTVKNHLCDARVPQLHGRGQHTEYRGNMDPSVLAVKKQGSCISSHIIETVKKILRKGSLASGIIVEQGILHHPCLLTQHQNLLRNLFWAGADFSKLNEIFKSLEPPDSSIQLSSTSLQAVIEFKKWWLIESKNKPRLAKLTTVAIRRLFSWDALNHIFALGSYPPCLNTLIHEYIPMRNHQDDA